MKWNDNNQVIKWKSARHNNKKIAQDQKSLTWILRISVGWIKRKQPWNSNLKVCIKKNKFCDTCFPEYSVRHLSWSWSHQHQHFTDHFQNQLWLFNVMCSSLFLGEDALVWNILAQFSQDLCTEYILLIHFLSTKARGLSSSQMSHCFPCSRKWILAEWPASDSPETWPGSGNLFFWSCEFRPQSSVLGQKTHA